MCYCDNTFTTANNDETSSLIDGDDSISMISFFDYKEISSSSVQVFSASTSFSFLSHFLMDVCMSSLNSASTGSPIASEEKKIISSHH